MDRVAERTGAFFAHLAQLNWWVPCRQVPHGLFGLVSLGSGLHLVLSALGGGWLTTPASPMFVVYVLSTFINAMAGLAILRRARRETREIFRSCAVFQICLVYWAVRFSTSCLGGGAYTIVIMDRAVSVAFVTSISLFTTRSVKIVPMSMGRGVVVGSVCLSLLLVYPLQLAIFGVEWWECVQTLYPEQGLAMVSYIYVPASWSFGVMLFGATLWSRKIIHDIAFASGCLGIVATTLLSTVLMQEEYLPAPRSTQKLWIPCPDPVDGTWSAWCATRLDISSLARRLLRFVRPS